MSSRNNNNNKKTKKSSVCSNAHSPSQSPSQSQTEQVSNGFTVGKKRKGFSITIDKSGTCNNGSSSCNGIATVQLTMEDGRTVNIQGATAEQLAAVIGGSMSVDEAAAEVSKNGNAPNTAASAPSTTTTSRSNAKVFGPELPPSFSSQTNSTTASDSDSCYYTNNGNTSTTSPSMEYTSMAATFAALGAGNYFNKVGDNVDMDAWKKKAAAAAVAAAAATTTNKGKGTMRNNNNNNKNNNDTNGMPCNEEEMKALVAMFMEIMGMSIDDGISTSTSNGTPPSPNNIHRGSGGKAASPSSSTNSKMGPHFSFSGGTASTIPDGISAAAAAAAAFFPDGSSWDALRRTYAAAQQKASETADEFYDPTGHDYDRELTFEEVEYLLQQRKKKEEFPTTKMDKEFSSGDWELLEHVPIEDFTYDDEETKERKAAKKRQKKQRKKEKSKEEAAQKAAEIELKKREKNILSWRSRVVSATQSNDTTKLDALLKESPLRKINQRESSMHLSNAGVTTHFEFLLPNTVPKNRISTDRGAEARLRLAQFVLNYDVRLAFEPLRTGRTAFHTACFYGDSQFVDLVLNTMQAHETENGKVLIPDEYFNAPCVESGWTPLHYAATSCSMDVMETLLKRGCGFDVLTDATHTWKKCDGKGVTPRELVELIKSGRHEKSIETHGVALQEISNTHFCHHQDRRGFVKNLERVQFRLLGIEKNGYSPPRDNKCVSPKAVVTEPQIAVVVENPLHNNPKKKKKKKGKNAKGTELVAASSDVSAKTNQVTSDVAVVAKPAKEGEEEQDPLVQALLGMGFEKEQIQAAIQACGGTDRATADDVVMQILGQTNETNHVEEEKESEVDDAAPEQQKKQVRTLDAQKDTVPTQQSIEEKEREAARKLAEKRELARRRNREWNMREQARQEHEASVKVVKKAVQQVFTASPKVPPQGTDVTNPSIARPLVQEMQGFQAPKIFAHATATTSRPTALPLQPERDTVGVSKTTQWHHPPSIPSRGAQTYPTSIPENADVTLQPPGLSKSGSIASISHPTPSVIYDDERTVSSFGSNRGLSVNSREFVPASFTATPPVLSSHTSPPGFMPATFQPVALPHQSHDQMVRDNPTDSVGPTQMQNSEIRATAKTFVPSTFSQPSGPMNYTQGHNDIPTPTMRRFHTGSAVSSSLLSRTSIPAGPLSDVGHSFSTFEPVPKMTPLSEDSTIPGSSLLSDLTAEEPLVPIPTLFGGAETKRNSSFLDPAPSIASVGGSSIWGDNGSEGIPLLGSALSSSLFGEDEDRLNNNKPSLWDMGSQKMTQGSIW
ncbi:ankyrin repeat domain protein [Nitzschia inconspicua]|uniref:Ankyrin repeat domain protein n=1 Tax=Nitzschia inconspicua TaxID=303405 RepID=A0A9K3PMF9_9STRA|nr:ankyrin repeat domain protein [Nitzschia inconspicua]